MKNRKPELLAPAGTWTALKAAVQSGADSVYFGVKGINMRHLASNFDILQIKKVMTFLKDHSCKGYLTLNTVLQEPDVIKAEKILKEANRAKVDAVILWDMAAFSLAQNLGLRVHLSTQASVANFKAVEAYHQLGADRIVLARECTLAEIKKIISQIRKKKLDCEIETFIHGAMCLSISGRCFLSLYSHVKSANEGKCLQPCRRQYYIRDVEDEADFVLGPDYILSPKDLCTIDFLDDLIKAGIHSFKIEGRIRSAEYVKIVTRVYRKAIDAYFEKNLSPELKEALKEDLYSVYTRGFSSGFYFGQPQEATSRRLEHQYEKIYLGEVTRFFKKISVAEIRLKAGTLNLTDEILVSGKTTSPEIIRVQEMQKEHEFVRRAGKGDAVGIKLPFVVRPRDKIFLWKKK